MLHYGFVANSYLIDKPHHQKLIAKACKVQPHTLACVLPTHAPRGALRFAKRDMSVD